VRGAGDPGLLRPNRRPPARGGTEGAASPPPPPPGGSEKHGPERPGGRVVPEVGRSVGSAAKRRGCRTRHHVGAGGGTWETPGAHRTPRWALRPTPGTRGDRVLPRPGPVFSGGRGLLGSILGSFGRPRRSIRPAIPRAGTGEGGENRGPFSEPGLREKGPNPANPTTFLLRSPGKGVGGPHLLTRAAGSVPPRAEGVSPVYRGAGWAFSGDRPALVLAQQTALRGGQAPAAGARDGLEDPIEGGGTSLRPHTGKHPALRPCTHIGDRDPSALCSTPRKPGEPPWKGPWTPTGAGGGGDNGTSGLFKNILRPTGVPDEFTKTAARRAAPTRGGLCRGPPQPPQRSSVRVGDRLAVSSDRPTQLRPVTERLQKAAPGRRPGWGNRAGRGREKAVSKGRSL